MADVEITFEREGRDGLVAAGTYLIDAASRLGVGVDAECGRRGQCDSCAVTVRSGGELLSEETRSEVEQLSAGRRGKGERLACQAKLERAGEVVIMTREKKSEEQPETDQKTDKYKEEFESLPLEKKIAQLLELEAIAIGETFSFVINSPFKVFEKAMDVLAELGLKIEDDAKKAERPDEHQAKNGNGQAKKTPRRGRKPGRPTKKTTTGRKTTAGRKSATAKKSPDKPEA